MSTTNTTHYAWAYPDVFTEADAWGTILNTLFQDIDADLYALDSVAVRSAGTLDVTITKNNAAFAVNNAAGGSAGYFNFTVAGNLRHRIAKNNVAESGLNAGSDLDFNTYDDAGAFLFRALRITRSSGDVTVTNNLSAGNMISTAGFASTLGGLNIGSDANIGGDANITGDIFQTGGLTTLGNGVGTQQLMITGGAGNTREIQLQTAGNARWSLRANTAAETGFDVGSNFQIRAFQDSGAVAPIVPFEITRNTFNTNIFALILQNALATAYGGTGSTTVAGARTNLGLAIGSDVQAWDADLDAVAALGNGIATRTGAGTWSNRTITGTAAEITVTNGAGAAGNPTLSLPNALTFTGKTITGGTFTGGTFNATGDVQASGNILGYGNNIMGYGAGSGGAVTQGTSNTNAVTLDNVCGVITMFTTVPGATTQSFTVNCSKISSQDNVVLNIQNNLPDVSVRAHNIGSGSFRITVTNANAGATAAALVINFHLLNTVNS